MKNILVIRPGAVGDALLTFPVLKALKGQYDMTRIMLVSNAQVLPLALAFGIAEQTFDFQDIQWSELFSSNGIRTSPIRDLLAETDLVICWMRDPHGIVEHNLKTSGVKHLIFAPGKPPADEDLHIVDYLTRTIGLQVEIPKFILPNIRQPEKNQSPPVGMRVDEELLGGPLWSPGRRKHGPLINVPTSTNRFIVIHPGSGAAEKCWPISGFVEVIKRLWKQNHPVLLLSGPADTERVEDLMKHISRPRASEMFKLLADAPLMELARHLQPCRCYLGNDSGITHLAAMLGVPTVAIFGPTDPKVWRPLGPFVKVIRGPKLEAISSDIVFEAISSYSL